MSGLFIRNHKTLEIAPIVREAGHAHAAWIHEQCATQSEQQLQEMIDAAGSAYEDEPQTADDHGIYLSTGSDGDDFNGYRDGRAMVFRAAYFVSNDGKESFPLTNFDRCAGSNDELIEEAIEWAKMTGMTYSGSPRARSTDDVSTLPLHIDALVAGLRVGPWVEGSGQASPR